jgi:hypothetical protein
MNTRKYQLSQFGLALGEIAAEKTFSICPNQQTKIEAAIQTGHQRNPWFTPENVRHAMQTWSEVLQPDSLEVWLSAYDLGAVSPKKVGIISAGNIPLVGLHDVICTWAAGHETHIKISSEDPLMAPVLAMLREISGNPDGFVEHPQFLKNADAYIATGSDNSARYFDYYFGKYPHIIRKNRNSVAVINGSETKNELQGLAEDIFRYFGLGCRSVSKIYVPKEYDFQPLFEAMYEYHPIVEHNRYGNNYDYYRTIYMMSKLAIWDNGFVILKEDENLASPIAVVFFEYYENLDELNTKLSNIQEQIQCVVGHNHLPFGTTQQPGLSDYADGVDTMRFLMNL